MSRTLRAFRTIMVTSSFGYSAQVLSVVAIPLFLSTVGTESYGLMVTVLAFMGYLGFADAGLSWGAMILIAQAHGRQDRLEIAHIVRHSAVLAAVSGAVVGLVLGLILLAASQGWRLPMFADQPASDALLLMAGIQLALNFQVSVFNNVFHGLQESYWPGFYQGLGRLVGLLGGIAAAWQTQSIAVVLGVQLAVTSGTGLAMAVHAWRRHRWAFAHGRWMDGGQYRAQVRIGAKNFLLQIGRVLGGTAPTMAISSVLGPAAVPYYTVPLTLVSMGFAPLNSWSSIMQSAYGEAWTSGAKDWVRTNFRRSLETTLLVGGLSVALFLALGDPFVRLWTDQKLWVDLSTALSVASIVLVGALLTAGQFLLTGLNRHRQAALAEVANGVLALGLVLLTVHWFGLAGAGIGVVLAALATSAWVLRREITLHLGEVCFPDARYILKIGASSLAGAVVAGVVARSGASGGGVAGWLQLALAASTGMGIFALISFASGAVGLDQVRTLVRRIKPNYRHS